MSSEEFERIMNFIIERQEYSATQIARLNEAQAELTNAQTRLADAHTRLADAHTRLSDTQTRLAEQLGDHEERIARFERSYVTISQLLEKHDKQLDAVTEGLNNVTDEVAKLARLVNRYITARGDGSNGGD